MECYLKYVITSLFQRLNHFTLVFSLQLCHTVLKFGVKLSDCECKEDINTSNKTIRLINFASIDERADLLYKMYNILRLFDTGNLQNFPYVYDDHHNNLQNFPYVYDDHHNNLQKTLNTFKSIKDVNSHLTRGSKSHKLVFPRARTTVYGINSITCQSIKTWNYLMENLIRPSSDKRYSDYNL